MWKPMGVEPEWVLLWIMASIIGALTVVAFNRGRMSSQAKQTYLTGIMALFHEGSIWASRGQGHEGNPYEDPSPEHRAWLFGFNVRHRQISEVAEAVERVVHTSRQEIDRLRAAHAIDSKPVEEGELDPGTADALEAFKRRNDPPPGSTGAKDHLPITHPTGGKPIDAPIEFGQYKEDYSADPVEFKARPGDDCYKDTLGG